MSLVRAAYKSNEHAYKLAVDDLKLLPYANVQIQISGNQMVLNERTKIASGSLKQIHDIGNGKVIAIPNGYPAEVWIEAVDHEMRVANKLKKIGLEVQDYEVIEIKTPQAYLPVMMMTHFSHMQLKGRQIREGIVKSGSPMIFGNIDNVKSVAYMRLTLKDMINDIITLIVNGIDLWPDSFGTLVIVNNESAPQFRVYFKDIYRHQMILQRGKLNLFLENDKINYPKLTQVSKYYLESSYNTLCNGMTLAEDESICSGSDDLVCDILDETFNKIKDEMIQHIVNSVVIKLKEFDPSKSNLISRSQSWCSGKASLN